MKKIVLFIVLTFQLFAYDDYIGLGAGYTQFNVATSTGDIDNSGASFTLDLGHKYGNYGRFHANGTYVTHDNDIYSAGSFSVGYDFLVPIFDNTFELYAGPVMGYTAYKERDFSLSGLHYGGEVGVLFEMTNNLELEVGYNFLSQDKSTDTHTAKNTQTGYVQVNLFFDKEKYFRYE